MTAPHFLLVGDNGHVSSLADSSKVQASMVGLLSLCSSRHDAKGRTVWNTHEMSLRALNRHFDGAIAGARADAAALREDAFDPGMGMFNPQDLTHRFRNVMEERHQPLVSQVVFPVNTEVPPGALGYTQYRAYSTGEAVVYRGGSGADIPEVGIGQASFTHPCVYLVSKASINWLENLRGNMAGLNTQERKMRAARLVIDQLEDNWTFNGSTEHGLFGLLNHPYVDTALSDVAYTDASTAADIASDFGYWANYASNVSGSAYKPNTLLIAPKLLTALSNRQYGTTAGGASGNVMDWLLKANKHITKVEECPKLNDAGGSGIHAMAFVRSGGPADTSCEIIKPMMPTLLPPEARALVTELFLVSGFGGLNQREAGDNLIVYVEGEA